MKKIFSLAVLASGLLFATAAQAQGDKSKRPSPPAKVMQKLTSGVTVSIDYSQPALKGRVIGESIEPKKDEVWRMGANEATVFEIDKDATVEGMPLKAGKYSLFGVWGDNGFTIHFNSAWKIWGTQYDANKATDVLTVTVKPDTTMASQEQLAYTIDKSGRVTLHWGTMAVGFMVK